MLPRFADTPEAATPLYLVEMADMPAVLASLEPPARAWAEAHRFDGKLGTVLALPTPAGGIGDVLVGWGDPAARAGQRFALAGAMAKLPRGTYRIETALDPAEAEEAALGWLLESYRFDRYRTAETPPPALVAPDGVAPGRVEAIAAGVCLGRDLINTPASDMGPDALEAAAVALAAEFGARIGVTRGEELLEANLPMIHAVGRAAAAAPRLIDMTWGDPMQPHVTLVGKGVCFDTGGLDIKPASAMRLMKKDMGGAATVLALARMIMARHLHVRLRVLIPAVENAIAGAAFRPGDVLRSRKGLTVEIGNTDAEGRLVLADAMTLACEEHPALLLDFATLTGAARVALGPDLPPLYSDSDALAGDLAAAGDRVADPLWRMPLWSPYDEDLRSPIADLDNAPGGGMAGSVTAALFLRRFVTGVREWAHVDIYGWVPKARPGRPKGGEPQGARAAFALLESRHG